MKNYNILQRLRLIYLIVITLVGFIIHACKKDNSKAVSNNITVDDARKWYESTYPIAGSTGRNLNAVKSPGIITASTANYDYTQQVKPNWNRANLYQRLGKNVVEVPIDSSVTIKTTMKMGAGGLPRYNKHAIAEVLSCYRMMV